MKCQIMKMVISDKAEHRFKTCMDIPDMLSVSETQLDALTFRLSFKGGNPLHIAEWMHFNLPSVYRTVGNIEVTVVCEWGEHVYRFDLEDSE